MRLSISLIRSLASIICLLCIIYSIFPWNIFLKSLSFYAANSFPLRLSPKFVVVSYHVFRLKYLSECEQWNCSAVWCSPLFSWMFAFYIVSLSVISWLSFMSIYFLHLSSSRFDRWFRIISSIDLRTMPVFWSYLSSIVLFPNSFHDDYENALSSIPKSLCNIYIWYIYNLSLLIFHWSRSSA